MEVGPSREQHTLRPKMHASLTLLALSSLLGLVNAEVAPAGSPIIFQGLNDCACAHIHTCISRNFLDEPVCIEDEIGTFGSIVFITGCSITAGQSISWVVQKGGVASGKGPAGQIIFPDANIQCLTINGTAADGTKLITANCDATNPLQQWNVNGDNTITLANTNFCVDLTNGDTTTFENPVQIWTCFAGKTEVMLAKIL